MKQKVFFVIGILFFCGIAYTLFFVYTYFRGAGPAFQKSPERIENIFDTIGSTEKKVTESVNNTDFPLKIEKGFALSIFASGIDNARVLAMGPKGNLFVSRTKDGIISMLEKTDQGVVEREILRGLKNPHGLAFDIENPNRLYIAEEDRLSFVDLFTDGSLQKIVDLPKSGRHFTRTLFWNSDNQLYISIGSSCDACHETDNRYASIMKVNLQEKRLEPYASGLRNAVFGTIHPVTGDLWVTEMGRDFLGDNAPPDEINIIRKGNFYGWPWYYGKNIRDTQFEPNTEVLLNAPLTESHIDLPSHVAPLGLAFVPEEGWPEEFWHDLFVAYHGSWNSTTPVGYKIVRLDLDQHGNLLGAHDFLSGWLTSDNKALGRPVDILTQPGGIFYMSDDKAGVIYKGEALSLSL